jgi:hypothetical protein
MAKKNFDLLQQEFSSFIQKYQIDNGFSNEQVFNEIATELARKARNKTCFSIYSAEFQNKCFLSKNDMIELLVNEIKNWQKYLIEDARSTTPG